MVGSLLKYQANIELSIDAFGFEEMLDILEVDRITTFRDFVVGGTGQWSLIHAEDDEREWKKDSFNTNSIE